MSRTPCKILLTGGTGYIASHTCVELIDAGFDTILFDNLSNSSASVVDRIESITGVRPAFIEGDVRDRQSLDRLFQAHRVDGVIHFAGLKAVGESVTDPLSYYVVNVGGSGTLFQSMRAASVSRIVFSSSATVYDPNAEMPLAETSPVGPVNPYGWSKLMVEQILTDLARAHADWRSISLRYFNPVGAHESGLIGEDPRGVPNNLMPYIGGVAVGRFPRLRVFGNDYATPDGTGVRDYIHVVDLAAGHVAAIRLLLAAGPIEKQVVNIGTGHAHTVFELLRAYERASGRNIAHEVVGRRDGDVPQSYAEVTVAHTYLNWQARRDLDQMCVDAWRWETMNVRRSVPGQRATSP
jgi:UDP-glucose 4-epimerase